MLNRFTGALRGSVQLCLIACCLASMLLAAASAQGLDYNSLEHVDEAYLSEVASFSSTMAFTNAELVRYSDSHVFMVTLFYDLAALVTFSTTNYPEGISRFGEYDGALGLYMYDITLGVQSGERIFATTSLETGMQLIFREEDFTSADLYAMDFFSARTSNGYYLGVTETTTGDPALLGLLNSNGQTVASLGDIGYPFTFGEGTEWNITSDDDTPQNRFSSTSQIYGNNLVSNVIPVPEPSGALLVSVAAAMALLRRRRK